MLWTSLKPLAYKLYPPTWWLQIFDLKKCRYLLAMPKAMNHSKRIRKYMSITSSLCAICEVGGVFCVLWYGGGFVCFLFFLKEGVKLTAGMIFLSFDSELLFWFLKCHCCWQKLLGLCSLTCIQCTQFQKSLLYAASHLAMQHKQLLICIIDVSHAVS